MAIRDVDQQLTEAGRGALLRVSSSITTKSCSSRMRAQVAPQTVDLPMRLRPVTIVGMRSMTRVTSSATSPSRPIMSSGATRPPSGKSAPTGSMGPYY